MNQLFSSAQRGALAALCCHKGKKEKRKQLKGTETENASQKFTRVEIGVKDGNAVELINDV